MPPAGLAAWVPEAASAPVPGAALVAAAAPVPAAVPVAGAVPVPAAVPVAQAVPTPAAVPVAGAVPVPVGVPMAAVLSAASLPAASAVPAGPDRLGSSRGSALAEHAGGLLRFDFGAEVGPAPPPCSDSRGRRTAP